MGQVQLFPLSFGPTDGDYIRMTDFGGYLPPQHLKNGECNLWWRGTSLLV
jgi:hypothetical protein